MLEQLFGSKTRVRLLRLFLSNQEDSYYVRELTRKIDAQINAVRNELDNLIEMDLLKVVDVSAATNLGEEAKTKAAQQRKYYCLNKSATIYPELRALFLKSRILLEKNFVREVTKAGDVHYLALLGYFMGDEDAPTDVFIVGTIGKTKLQTLIKNFEREVGREINYTALTLEEFNYRKDLTDKFLYQILDSQKVVVCDTLSERVRVPAL